MRDDDAVDLSPEQRAAVTRTNQDACSVSGPGSGKTRALVERYAILAMTFTGKAATNIEQRLVNHFAADPSKRRAVEKPPVSTIHAFCQSRDARESTALQSATMECSV